MSSCRNNKLTLQSLHCDMCSCHSGANVVVGFMGFRAEDGDKMFLLNVGVYVQAHRAL